MKRYLPPILLVWLTLSATALAETPPFINLSNQPLGTVESPLILRTYFPDPGLGPEVLPNHHLGYRARKYKPGKGDVEGFDDPVEGIPAAIGVNFGTTLSLCWDTTECRLLYAWQGGFLDMTNYWGEPESGRRKSFDYVPHLVGPLIYVARGSHPLAIFDNFVEDLSPKFLSYRLDKGVPVFAYMMGDIEVNVKIEPGEKPMSFVKHYTIKGAKEGTGYKETGYDFEVKKGDAENTFTVTVQGKVTQSKERIDTTLKFKTDKANKTWGEALYTQLGCFVCHSTDGTRGHGPTFTGLFGHEVKIQGQEAPIKADEAYIRESIQNPMAKVVEGFPAGYMPPYPVEEKMIDSLILYIKSLKDE